LFTQQLNIASVRDLSVEGPKLGATHVCTRLANKITPGKLADWPGPERTASALRMGVLISEGT
jgi:hypothetical protein